MPYIKQERRYELMYDGDTAKTPGELNYQITRICLSYIMGRTLATEQGPSYETYNAVIGALESAKLEMYRRQIAPYEDRKIEENGDVY